MNRVKHLNGTTRLFILTITIAVLGLAVVQAHDSEHPHEHEEDEIPQSPPNNPLNNDDPDSPEDYWGPPEGTSPTAEPNIEEELPHDPDPFRFPTCPEGQYPTMPEPAFPGGPAPLPSQYVCAEPPRIPTVEEFTAKICELEGESTAVTAARLGTECGELCKSANNEKVRTACVLLCIAVGTYIINQNFEKCDG